MTLNLPLPWWVFLLAGSLGILYLARYSRAAKPKTSVVMNHRVFSVEELAKYNGTNAKLPVYVAVKGWIFDVSVRREMYCPGQGYAIFAGKDASLALGKSSLDPADAHADFSSLNAEQAIVLADWEAYYRKRYAIVGHVWASVAAHELARASDSRDENKKID